jgi:DNA-binding PadR family transcriptional regulator
LTVQNENIGGKIRKYYRITEKGLEVLQIAKEKAQELTRELFE